MNVIEILEKKRDGKVLTEAEIRFIIEGYTKGDIPDYQMAAFNMAVYFQGMNFDETMYFTKMMLESGEIMDLSYIDGFKVDKHSTGGVGDKTSLILAPIVASYDVYVPMISGRGLGHTGGTLDKLEAIPGFSVDVTVEEYKKIIKDVKFLIVGQSKEVCPADKKLYALRDVTATVDSIPLICGSIMSKKLAEGIDGLVLDVKTGSGAFMQRLEDAQELARNLVEVGERMGKKVIALITDMNQPLGNYIGNSLEIIETIEILKGNINNDLTELSILLASYMLVVSKKAFKLDEAKKMAYQSINNGKALEKFREMIIAQKGDPNVIEDYSLLPTAKNKLTIKSEKDGYIDKILTDEVGKASMYLGGGRQKSDDTIDYAVGVVVHKKLGDNVNKGDDLYTIHYNRDNNLAQAKKILSNAYKIEDRLNRLVHDVIEKEKI